MSKQTNSDITMCYHFSFSAVLHAHVYLIFLRGFAPIPESDGQFYVLLLHSAGLLVRHTMDCVFSCFLISNDSVIVNSEYE